MAYDKIIHGLNQARLAGTAYPVISALIQVAQTYAEVSSISLFSLRII